MSLASVVMPMRNAEAYVRASVESLLSEREVDVEVIVVDDGSTDRSAEVVRAIGDPRVKVVPGPQQGIPAALNTAVEHATGDYFLRCDSDDLFVPGRIDAQVRWLEANPEFGAVCGNFRTVDEKGRLISDMMAGTEATEITHELQNGDTRTHLGTYCVRMSLVRELGGFRAYFRMAQDIDFQTRVGTASRVWFLPEMTYDYRLIAQSITHASSAALREFLTSQARLFARQRRDRGQDDLQLGQAADPPQNVGKRSSSRGHIVDVLVGRAWREHRAGERGQAIRTGLRAVGRQPLRLATWRSLLALTYKPIPDSSAPSE